MKNKGTMEERVDVQLPNTQSAVLRELTDFLAKYEHLKFPLESLRDLSLTKILLVSFHERSIASLKIHQPNTLVKT